MKLTLFLTKMEQAAMVAVMGDFDRARARVAEAQKAAEDVINEVVAAHESLPLSPGSVVQMSVVDGRPALVYEPATPPSVAEPEPAKGAPANRIAEAVTAVGDGNGAKE